jgi:putative iron-dependent peroxidase
MGLIRALSCRERARTCETACVSPQSQGVLTPLTAAAIFLVLTVEPGGEGATRELLSEASALRRSVGFRIPEGELVCVTGIGSTLWDRMLGEPRPAELHPFPGFQGERHVAPATPGDLLFHIRAHRLDLCFELAARLTERLAGVAEVVDEVHGFRSFDERDLLGFVDGTENPEGEDACEAVTIGDEDSEFAGGSYVIVQKYLHDILGWNALSVEQQERVIGRTKLDDIELADDVKPADSHVALNTIEDESGRQQQIMRFNMPFGRVAAREHGTYFIGYARTASLIEQMLTNMFVGDPPGTYDRVLDFSTAVTGGLFFVPTVEFLENSLSAAIVAAEDEAKGAGELDDGQSPVLTPQPADGPSDGSLGLGGLREAMR